MKFFKAEAFEKHLDEALPDHSSCLYGILINDPFERQVVINKILDKLGLSLQTYQVLETPWETFLEELDSPSLFDQKRVLLYEGIEKLKKGDAMAQAFKEAPETAIVILSGTSFPFYELVKKEMILLDLSKEKPWERASRLKRWLLETVQKQGKKLTAEAAAYLTEFCVVDFASLIQEVEKLITYVGESPEITLQAVKAVSTLQPIHKGWQLSESIVWGGEVSFSLLHRLDSQDLFTFLGQLRYQLQLGLSIVSLIEKGKRNQIAKEYPKLPPNLLERYERLAKKLSYSYFQAGLKDLFELELQARMKTATLSFLLDRLVGLFKERALA